MGDKGKKWRPDIARTLVNLYELQPVLYKTTSPAYHNKVARHNALETIKAQLLEISKEHFTVEEIQKKISSLRTQFNEVLKQKNKCQPSGSATSDDTLKPSWWLYEDMCFLKAHLKKDKGESNLNLPGETEQESEQTDEQDAYEDREDYVVSPTTGILSLSSGPSSRPESSTSFVKTPTTNRKKRRSNVNDESKILQEALDVIVHSDSTPKADFTPELSSFLNYIGNELKAITEPKILRHCKRRIIDLIETAQDENEED